MQQVNLDQITDIGHLKAMGFDEMSKIGNCQKQIELFQQNLSNIEQRIAQIENTKHELPAPLDDKV